MKIYTRAGDQGSTALFGGGKLAKCDIRIAAYGTIDELNSVLGLARAGGVPPQIDRALLQLQNQLFDLGAELASLKTEDRGTKLLQEPDVIAMEKLIDSFEKNLPPLTTFILPGGCQAAATLHLARCVCRRAEREIVALSMEANLRETVLQFVNRAGDLLFVLARAANATAKVKDVSWTRLP